MSVASRKLSLRKSGAKYRALHPEKVQRIQCNKNLKRRYGLTLAEYEALAEAQNGKCAICEKSNSNNRRFHVDHCHATGRIRGLLCNGCNVGLGHFQDDVDLMFRGIAYLKRNLSISERVQK